MQASTVGAPTFTAKSATQQTNVSGVLTLGTLTATSGTPQNTSSGTSFPTALQVTLLDGFFNPVVGVPITFSVPTSGASAVLSAVTVLTDAKGQASVTATANGTAGTYAVAASFGTLNAVFTLTNTATSGGGNTGGGNTGGGTGGGGTGGGGTAIRYFAVGADAGGGPAVNVYDASTGVLKTSFFAFAPSFRGGVRVAVGDVNGDGTDDIITAAGPGGGPQVTVYDGNTFQPILSFFGLAPTFTGGVYVAA